MSESLAKSGFNEELAALRGQIDAVDEKLVSLIRQRTDIVKQVGLLKGKHVPDLCPIRAAREATQLRNIIKAFEGSAFPAAAAISIWRLIISASLSVESELKLSIYAPADDASCALLAGEYFGQFLPALRQTAPRRVIADVIDGKATIGVLPAPRMDETQPWWLDLAAMGTENKAPTIFARLPFATPARPAQGGYALAIASVASEASGNDISFLALSMDESLSTHRLQSAFATAKIEANWAGMSTQADGKRQLLVEMKGYHTPETSALKSMLTSLGNGLNSAVFLGSYAVPVTLATAKAD